MKTGAALLIAIGIGLPLGTCTGAIVGGLLGGGLFTVFVVAVAIMGISYSVATTTWQREEQETEIRQRLLDELRSRDR